MLFPLVGCGLMKYLILLVTPGFLPSQLAFLRAMTGKIRSNQFAGSVSRFWEVRSKFFRGLYLTMKSIGQSILFFRLLLHYTLHSWHPFFHLVFKSSLYFKEGDSNL
jgi:hypothetical protein